MKVSELIDILVQMPPTHDILLECKEYDWLSADIAVLENAEEGTLILCGDIDGSN